MVVLLGTDGSFLFSLDLSETPILTVLETIQKELTYDTKTPLQQFLQYVGNQVQNRICGFDMKLSRHPFYCYSLPVDEVETSCPSNLNESTHLPPLTSGCPPNAHYASHRSLFGRAITDISSVVNDFLFQGQLRRVSGTSTNNQT